MAGLLRGWVRDEPLSQALRYANACGAIVVSRHGCAPAMPSWTELQFFFERKQGVARLREDEELEHVHRATTRRPTPRCTRGAGVRPSQPARRLRRAFRRRRAAASRTSSRWSRARPSTATRPNTRSTLLTMKRRSLRRGVIVDARYGTPILHRSPARACGSRARSKRPVRGRCSSRRAPTWLSILTDWPSELIVKCLVFHHPDDEAALARGNCRRCATCTARANAPATSCCSR